MNRDRMIYDKTASIFFVFGGVICGLAVALGAFGAHALENVMADWYPPDSAMKKLDSWETGVRYQFFHGLAILVVASARVAGCLRGSILFVGLSFLIGTMIFSGGLYGWVLSDVTICVQLVPLGGLLMLVGWGLLVWQSCVALRPNRTIDS